MKRPLRILLVDDSLHFLEATRDFLHYQELIEVVGVAIEGDDALTQSRTLEPDIILLDLSLANCSGLDLIPALKRNVPRTRVIVLTMMEESSYRAAALQAGADAFVHKSNMTKNLLSVIHKTMGLNNNASVTHKECTTASQDLPFQKLMEHLPDLIYRYEFTPWRGFSYVNPAATYLTGYTPEEHYADPDLEVKLIHPDDRHLLDMAQQGNTNESQPLTLRWIRKDGAVIWMEQQNVAIHSETGELVAIEGMARDITERKHVAEQVRCHALAAEDKLRESNADLEKRVADRTLALRQANIEMERALRVKDEFLANMSHELRTPLNAILGLSESLAEQTVGRLNDKQQKYVHIISESGHHLLSLINDILDLAKIEAGQIVLNRTKTNIKFICESSLRLVRQLARKKNQEIVFDMCPGLDLIWADERRLKQMLVNLLGNAVKFTPAGGKIGLEVQGDPVSNQVMFTVWDTGIGISEEDMTRLFQPFVQLDSNLAREATGTGLGLALVAQMARLHGGSVNASSRFGIGSRFAITLPCEPTLATDTSSRLKITDKFHVAGPGEENNQ